MIAYIIWNETVPIILYRSLSNCYSIRIKKYYNKTIRLFDEKWGEEWHKCIFRKTYYGKCPCEILDRKQICRNASRERVTHASREITFYFISRRRKKIKQVQIFLLRHDSKIYRTMYFCVCMYFKINKPHMRKKSEIVLNLQNGTIFYKIENIQCAKENFVC